MNKRQAKIIALRQAYAAIEKALGVGDDTPRTEADQLKVDNELDTISQSLYERLARLEERG